MIHVLQMIRRRYPDRGDSIVRYLFALSAAALFIGASLLWLR